MSGSSRSGARKKVLLVAGVLLGAGAVAGVGLLGMWGYERARGVVVAKSAQVESARVNRQRPIMTVAPAPLPRGLPLVERPGKDEFGYPRSYVDGPALRSLLHHGRYQELTSYFEQFQREFEADPLKELWPISAAETFCSAEPALLPQLEEWLRKAPSSFAPHLALGAYFTEVAYKRRGDKWYKDTPAADIAAMEEAAARAQGHLKQALSLAPKLVAAMRLSISGPQSGAWAGDRKLLATGTAFCPSCFSLRAAYITGLVPRWGGSYEQMRTFADTLPIAAYPRLKLLIGYAQVDQSQLARSAKRLPDALVAANAACALGNHWDFFLERARVYIALERYEDARKDLDSALDLRPDLPRLHFARSELFVRREEWESAAAELLTAVRVDATDSATRWLLPRVVRGLSEQGLRAHEQGKRDDAVRLLTVAEQLAPFDREVRQRREQAVRGNVTGTPEEIARLEAKVKEAPDDFATLQQLDYALAKNRSYPRVIELWTAYLTRHPDDGRAFFERSGAFFNSGRRAEAGADIDKACELGVDEACAYAARMPRK